MSSNPPEAAGRLALLGRRLIRCQACPRLSRYLAEMHRKWPGHWCRPVPGFGDPAAEIVLVGLAPGRHGANRTGRMFSGDASGRWLFRALHASGFCNRKESLGPGDGLRLKNVYITAAARCAPPQNKPTSSELDRCRSWLAQELALLPRKRLFIAIGKIGHDAILKVLEGKPSDFPFGHGRLHDLGGGLRILDTYHCSRQNTNTGKLTWPMFVEIFRKARSLIRGAVRL